MSPKRKTYRARTSAVGRWLTDLVYPPRCAGCSRRGHWVCSYCRSRFPAEVEQLCTACGVKWCVSVEDATDEFRPYAFGRYDDWLRQAIISYKYQAERCRHQHLGTLLVPIVQHLGHVDCLVPVPLHRNRERARGFNQAQLLAGTVGDVLGLPVNPALIRTMDTRQQVSLSGDLRRTNVVGAFESREDMTGRHVVLIDDVMTTGATLQECATVLRAAGAASVRTVTLAHG